MATKPPIFVLILLRSVAASSILETKQQPDTKQNMLCLKRSMLILCAVLRAVFSIWRM